MQSILLDKPFEGELDTPYSFELDDFQKHAYKLINEDGVKNILCCAHTGSGKSMLIEFSLLRAYELGKKIICCTPVKALSNQSFYGLTKKFPHIKIGLITGDHKCNPDADCLIMTTEILSILLVNKSIKYDDFEISNIDFNDFFAVIFDEVHYINDVERGGVWEKCIMNMPKNVNQVMLSATIDNPENFINWVQTCNNNPSYLLTNYKRVVPLYFNYSYWVNTKKLSKELEQNEHKLHKFMPFADTDHKFIEPDRLKSINDLNKMFKDIKVNSTYIINEICKELQVKQMTPAIFFIFSKKRCIEIAKSITTSYNDYNENVEVNRAFDYYLSKLENKEGYKNSFQYNEIRDLALKGIAVHHAGLIPVFKEIIEMLFSKNLIKVLFATETFAVGLNMPTKTVIFTDVFKYDNNGKRRLATHEFIQMSGRAGRRGIDTKGFVIITPQLFSEDVSSRELENLLFGSSQKIQSKFNIDYQWVLSVIQNNAIDRIEELTSKSLLNCELSKEIQTTKHQISKLDTLISSINLNNPELYEEYQILYNQLNNIIRPSNNQMKKLEQKIKEVKPKLVEFDKYNELMKHKKEHEESSKYLVTLNNYIRSEVDNQIRILKKEGFITDDNQLTQKGQIAIKISELDSITTTNILVSEYLDELFYTKNYYKILALFTLICDGKGNDNYEIQETYHDVLKFIREIGNIKINRELLCPVLDWYDGKYSRDIVEIYEIHEGDLIKSINKIIHLLDEVVQVFMLLNKVEYVDIIIEIKNKLIGEPGRNIITMESLYLKII